MSNISKQPVVAPAARPVTARPATKQVPKRVIYDSRVLAAAWEVENSADVQQVAAQQPATVADSADVYDPFEEDDRLAQLEDDPFDEPTEDSIPVPESDSSLDSIEQAIEDEIRRRSGDDLEEQPMEDTEESGPLDEDPFGEGLTEEDPLDILDDPDLSQDDDKQDGKLQLDQGDWQTPDLGLDSEQSVAPQDDSPTAEELEEQRKELEKERRESEAGCREELAKIEADRISSIDLSIRVEGNAGEDYPYECAVGTRSYEPRQWPQITYNWKAAALCHKPLYFEQVQLERYGHSWGPYVQPIMSGVHFFGTLPVLPYKMGIRTPTECVYTLGYYRPGSCAPYLIEPIPFTWRAAFLEAGVATGISFAIP